VCTHRTGVRRILPVLALVTLWVSACAAVPPPLRLPAGPVTAAELPAVLEVYTGAPAVPGNAVEVLQNGEQIFPAILEAIAAARRTVTVEQYTWEEGPPAREIAAALAGRAEAGVEVKVLLDGFGSRGIPPGDLALMRAAGGEVRFVRPLRQLTTLNHRDHRRVLVVDGRVGFAGDVGFGRNWAGDGRTAGRWRTTHVRVEGPVVEHLQRAFAQHWLEATGVLLAGPGYYPASRAPAGTATVQVIESAPLHGRFDVYTMLGLAVAAARRTLYLTSPYILPDEALLDGLSRAVRRGVRVVVLGPGPDDLNLVRGLSRGQFGRLIRDGVEVYEYLPGRLHTKAIVVDGRWATLGSANLDNRSFALNAELNLAVAAPEVARGLERTLAEDLAHARRVDGERWRSRGLHPRLLELLASPLRRLL
jgi:cardiolipin synthase